MWARGAEDSPRYARGEPHTCCVPAPAAWLAIFGVHHAMYSHKTERRQLFRRGSKGWAGLTRAGSLSFQQRQGDGDGAAGAGQVQRRGAGAQPGAVPPIAEQHPRVDRCPRLSRGAAEVTRVPHHSEQHEAGCCFIRAAIYVQARAYMAERGRKESGQGSE